MSRFLMLLLLLLPLGGVADSIYRTVDAQGNVVFTDAPGADTVPSDKIEIQRINTIEPPPEAPPSASTSTSAGNGSSEAATSPYTVTIVTPANETSFPMGPGNFSVSVRVNPPLAKYHGLQLFVDDEPRGDPQASNIWDLTNVFRGQHDLTVGVIDKQGEILSLSPPVRVYVHRPSSNFKNK